MTAARGINAATLYFTSKANSYGVVTNRWYDGIAAPFKLLKGSIHFIRISEVRRFEYLKDKCSHQSFYQCLSSKMMTAKDCSQHGEPCTVFSLPGKTPSSDFPQCSNNKSLDCQKSLFHKLSHEDNECKLKRLCDVEEYSVFEETDVLTESVQVWSLAQFSSVCD